jgi:hypothetical protein
VLFGPKTSDLHHPFSIRAPTNRSINPTFHHSSSAYFTFIFQP